MNKCDDIDRERDAKIALPAPQLADYSLEIVQQVQRRHAGGGSGPF